jgi:hypothetical protein
VTSEKLIGQGYLPKELPPGFTSELLAQNLEEVKSRWADFENLQTIRQEGESKSDWNQKKNDFNSKYGCSQPAYFSISKGKLARRVLQIPNPKHFITVCELISKNWEFYNTLFESSPFSMSYPMLDEGEAKRAVKTFSTGVPYLRDEILKRSARKVIQIKADISKFYPTIYTHTIPWSIVGKSTAKKMLKTSKSELNNLVESGDLDAINYSAADKLDSAVRACQDRQSIGVPIGPDTSHVIAELIACRLDGEIQDKFKGIDIEAVRFYDDYYIFVSTLDEADKVVKGLQTILNEYQLEVNDKKVEINEYPFSFENDWVTKLNQYEFKKTNLRNGLKHYFSLVWGIGAIHKSKTDWVFKYALRTFEFRTIEIQKNCWELFENLLLKTTLIQPAILDITTRILLSYRECITDRSIQKISQLVCDIIVSHAPVNHSFEVSWALWLAKSFEVEISEETANLVLKTKDDSSILILLCMAREMELVKGNPNFEVIESILKDDVLFSSNWLLAYESLKNGWLIPAEDHLIEKNGFFKILADLNISFLNWELQLSAIPKREIKKEDQTEREYVSGAIVKEPKTNYKSGLIDISGMW